MISSFATGAGQSLRMTPALAVACERQMTFQEDGQCDSSLGAVAYNPLLSP
jgi:hypothetical protein